MSSPATPAISHDIKKFSGVLFALSFRRLVASQDAQKMLVLLRFVFDPEELRAYCRDEWLKVSACSAHLLLRLSD